MTEYRDPLYDSHAHLVSDDQVKYPRVPMPTGGVAGGSGAPRPMNNPSRPPGSIGQPGGVHGDKPINLKPTAEQLHGWMAEENVVAIAAVQKGIIYRTDNSYIVDAAALFPDDMRAVIIVDPQAPETLDMIRDYAKRGVVGVRFFGVGIADKKAWMTSPESMKVWALADEIGQVVDIEAPNQGADDLIPVVEEIADKFPNLPIVLDHVFNPLVWEADFGIDDRFKGFAARKNIYVKWTSINMDVAYGHGKKPEEVLRRAVDFYGADKVMWGSDIGTSSGTYKDMVARAIASTALLTDEERRKVLHDNGRRVFDKWVG
jgi:predicted TIM-barrel fold metal-dependent hydrolase